VEDLLDEILKFRVKYSEGRELYKHFTNPLNIYSELDRAVRFFILNRITFSEQLIQEDILKKLLNRDLLNLLLQD
jgi:DNA adenine methylase